MSLIATAIFTSGYLIPLFITYLIFHRIITSDMTGYQLNTAINTNNFCLVCGCCSAGAHPAYA